MPVFSAPFPYMDNHFASFFVFSVHLFVKKNFILILISPSFLDKSSSMSSMLFVTLHCPLFNIALKSLHTSPSRLSSLSVACTSPLSGYPGRDSANSLSMGSWVVSSLFLAQTVLQCVISSACHFVHVKVYQGGLIGQKMKTDVICQILLHSPLWGLYHFAFP